MLSLLSLTTIGSEPMPTLTVRNLEDEVVKRLRIRAAENGRSAEAEHRAILRAVLLAEAAPDTARREAAARLAAFRARTAGRGAPSSAALLAEARDLRTAALAPEAAVER
jgi:plasmid stability protein